MTLNIRDTKGADNSERALRAYIKQNYGSRGEIFGDKLNDLAAEAKAKGIAIEGLKDFGANGVTGYITSENKEKLDALYGETVGITQKGIAAGKAGAQDTVESYKDFYKIHVNGAINVINDASKLIGADEIPKFETKGSFWKRAGREQAGEIASGIGASAASGGLGTAGKVINVADTIVSTNEAITGEDMRTGEKLSAFQRIVQGVGAAISTPSAMRDADEAVTAVAKKAEKVFTDIGKGGGLPSLAEDFAQRWREARMNSGLGWQTQTANNAPMTQMPMAASDEAARKTLNSAENISEAEQAKKLAQADETKPTKVTAENLEILAEQRKQFKEIFGGKRYDGYADEIEKVKVTRTDLRDIPTEDLVAMRGYTSDDYAMLNEALRSGNKEEIKRLEPYIKVAESGLSQLPPYQGTVFRGTSLNAEQLNKYKAGEVVTEEAFTSTSTVAGEAFDGNVMFVINSNNGKEVSALSVYPNEKEVLFKTDTKFKVLSVDTNEQTGKKVILLDEI